MSQSTTRHTSAEISLACMRVRASFWPDEDGRAISSVLSVTSGGAHTQSNITAAELRQLAALLTQQAGRLDNATKQATPNAYDPEQHHAINKQQLLKDRAVPTLSLAAHASTGATPAGLFVAKNESEWLNRCAERFISRAQLPAHQAQEFAKSSFENLDKDLTESPEIAADEEMSNWSD